MLTIQRSHSRSQNLVHNCFERKGFIAVALRLPLLTKVRTRSNSSGGGGAGGTKHWFCALLLTSAL